MALSEQQLRTLAVQKIPEVLYYMDDDGSRQYIVHKTPEIRGQRIFVTIDEDISYGKLQAITPAWLKLENAGTDVIEFKLVLKSARAALGS